MGAAQWQEVQGKGFTFEAPAGWTVNGAAASNGAVDRVQVSIFELEHPYTRSKRAAVAGELDGDAASLAQQLKGAVSSKAALEVSGLDGRTYAIAYDGKVEEITFAFRGIREYELLCRRPAGEANAACARLVSSFRLA